MRNPSNYVAAMIVAVMGLAFANISNGQVYVDDFNDLDDDGWDRYDPLSGGDFAFPDGTFQISTTAPDNAFFGPARVGTTLSGVSMTDFQVSVDLLTWDETLPQTFGIIARAENIGLGTSTGYMFSFSPGESAGRSFTALAIDRLDNEQAASGGAKYNLPGGDLTPGEGYRMVFVGIGGQFSGSIYALSDLNTALGSVAFTDDTYQSGAFGLLVTDSNISDLQGATATFDNFSLTAVPEPAHAALAMGVFGALVSVVRRRGRVDGPLPPSLSRYQPQAEDHENGRDADDSRAEGDPSVALADGQARQLLHHPKVTVVHVRHRHCTRSHREHAKRQYHPLPQQGAKRKFLSVQ